MSNHRTQRRTEVPLRGKLTGRTWRSRWAAIGAAVAVTLGAGGLISVNAASPISAVVAISPTRVLDTRIDVGLIDAFQEGKARVLDVTGTIPIVLPGNEPGSAAPVPDGATAIVANVTVVGPTTQGFVSVRPGDATGSPTTSSLNFQAGAIVPNSVTVELAPNGTINLFFRGTAASATTDLLIDIVAYHVEGSGGGAPGRKGDTGDPGAKGDPGSQGDPGAKGDQGMKGVQGERGEAGPKGDAGAKGGRGAAGPQGFSAWDEIPSGVTVSGFELITIYPTGAASHQFTVALPGLARVDLHDSARINFSADFSAVTTDDDDGCVGSPNAPLAPPGNVCLYLTGTLNAQRASAGRNWRLQDHGFTVTVDSAGAGEAGISFSWAYTAP